MQQNPITEATLEDYQNTTPYQNTIRTTKLIKTPSTKPAFLPNMKHKLTKSNQRKSSKTPTTGKIS
jgi:hypothetical protein